jgi:hypothetical protein
MTQIDIENRKKYNNEYYTKNKEKIKIKKYCEHNKIRSICKECSGGSICEHDKQRTRCKECKGGSICEHNKNKNICKECHGNALCYHEKLRTRCKECKGGSICEHEKIRSICKECKGGSICEHEKIRSICKDCKGGSICEHYKQKRACKNCNFYSYLAILQRNHLRKLFKINNFVKNKTSIKYLGCEIYYFKTFIEKKMTNSMNWNNIHLDHIKPIDAFNLENIDDFLNCCNYTNYQPLLINDNIRKSNLWSENDELFWIDNIIGKNYFEIYMPLKYK